MTNETAGMEPAGRVLPIFRGEYLDSVVYENPDIVLYKNSSYVAKQTTIGNPPPTETLSDDYWQTVARGIIDADISESTIEFTAADQRSNIESGEKAKSIMGKIHKFLADLKTVAFTGSYNDLGNRPSIPAAASNGKLTIQRNGTAVQTFTANQSSDVTANIAVPAVSSSAAVTQTGQMALDAVEKNAAVPGTLANQIQQQNSNLDIADNIVLAWNQYTILRKVATLRNGVVEFTVVVKSNFTASGHWTVFYGLPTPVMVSNEITGIVQTCVAVYNEEDKHYNIDTSIDVCPYAKLSAYSGGTVAISNPEKDRIYIVQGTYITSD